MKEIDVAPYLIEPIEGLKSDEINFVARIKKIGEPEDKKDEEEISWLTEKLSVAREKIKLLNEKRSTFIVTGMCKDVGAGDVLISNMFPLQNKIPVNMRVSEVNQRDHKGIFKNPSDATMSFFEAFCNLI